MTGEASPPVEEVAIAVVFDPQLPLTGPQLFVTLRDLTSQFSRIEEQLPYEMIEERPAEQQLVASNQVPFRVVNRSGVMDHRYWLFDPMDDSLVIQIQSNYLAVNWRRTKSSSSYIGFDRLMEHFQSVLTRIQNSVLESGGSELVIRRSELTYVNIVRPNSLWSTHSDLSAILDISIPGVSEVEQLNVSYSRSLYSATKVFRGRLNLVAQTAFTNSQDALPIGQAILADLTPVINITTIVRSANLVDPGHDAALEFLLDAHEEAGRAFRDLTTRDAKVNWGI